MNALITSSVRTTISITIACAAVVAGTAEVGTADTSAHIFRSSSALLGRSPILAGSRTAAIAKVRTVFAFPGGAGGEEPNGALIEDANGRLFGTAGVVYELDRKGSTFTETVLGKSGGSGLVFSRYSLYGTGSGGEHLQGTLNRLYFENGAYHERSIYSFLGLSLGDGSEPSGSLIPDANGTLYGLTRTGGDPHFMSSGTVFTLSGTGTGPWSETVLYSFKGAPQDGALPVGSLIADSRGELYGETSIGGMQAPRYYNTTGLGTVFELMPSANGYTERVIYAFTGQADGAFPTGGLLLDAAGDVFGETPVDDVFGALPGVTGCAGCGTVFELVPSGDGYAERTIYTFKGAASGDGSKPIGGLIEDGSGNLYGATAEGGKGSATGLGTVFKLSPSGSTYVEHVLHRFAGRDGSSPSGPLLLSQSGVLYGTTATGGPGCTATSEGCGVVYEVVP